jgi:hypothetical protein
MSKSYSKIISGLSIQRRKDLSALRRVIRASKPKEIKEALVGNQLVYSLPLRYFSDSYNKRPLLYATLTDRRAYISLNLICIHNDKKYRAKFAKKLLNTGVCAGASGCCYKIKTVNDELLRLLKKDLRKCDLKKFIGAFAKYRQK